MRCVQVPEHVVYGNKRFIACPCEGFRKGQPHQQRPHQPRPIGYGDTVYRLQSFACFLQSGFDNRQYPFGVLPARNLRHDTLIRFVKWYLSRHHRADDFMSVLHDGGCRFIAGAFYSKYLHSVVPIVP